MPENWGGSFCIYSSHLRPRWTRSQEGGKDSITLPCPWCWWLVLLSKALGTSRQQQPGDLCNKPTTRAGRQRLLLPIPPAHSSDTATQYLIQDQVPLALCSVMLFSTGAQTVPCSYRRPDKPPSFKKTALLHLLGMCQSHHQHKSPIRQLAQSTWHSWRHLLS